jgi:Flp pilus assembly protein TadD
LRGRQPYADWVAWSVALYLPVANIVALYPAIAAQWLFTPEHNLYAPLAGIAVCVAAGATHAADRMRVRSRRLAIACIATLLLIYATATVTRLRDWHDEATLFQSAVAAGSTSPRVWYNHANMLVRRGALAAGINAYRKALQLAPHDVDMWMNLGVALQRHGELPAAIDAYTRAVALAPPSALLLENLGTAQLRMGDVHGARTSFTRALALDPQRVTSRQALVAIDESR